MFLLRFTINCQTLKDALGGNKTCHNDAIDQQQNKLQESIF